MKFCTLPDLRVSSFRRGHANLLCIVPILTDDPRRESPVTASMPLLPIPISYLRPPGVSGPHMLVVSLYTLSQGPPDGSWRPWSTGPQGVRVNSIGVSRFFPNHLRRVGLFCFVLFCRVTLCPTPSEPPTSRWTCGCASGCRGASGSHV